MYVCMYVCVCVCVYVCMYVCMYVKAIGLVYAVYPPFHPLHEIKGFLFISSPFLVMVPFLDAAEELADQVSKLVLDPRDRTGETGVQTKCSLPKIHSSHTHRPSILTYNTGKSRTNSKPWLQFADPAREERSNCVEDENALSAFTASSELLPPIVTTSRTALATVSTQARPIITSSNQSKTFFRGCVLLSVLSLSQLKSKQ